MQNLKDSIDITFVSTVPGLTSIEECLPQSAQKVIPDWWKTVPYTTLKLDRDSTINPKPTVKACPAIPEYFSQGIILPMWCDVYLKYSKETDVWFWETSDNRFTWDTHGKHQLVDYKIPSYQGKNSSIVCNLISDK